MALDLLGPLLSSDSVLVMVDYFSRYYETEIMCSTTCAEIIKSLKRIFMIHGLPLSVTSDMGRLKDIWKAVVSITREPYHYGPKQMAKWKGRTNSFEKVADSASQGETVEERSS